MTSELQQNINIQVTEKISEIFSKTKGDVVWGLELIDEINPEEDQYTSKVNIKINALNGYRFPFKINEDEAKLLGHIIEERAANFDYMLSSTTQSTVNESITLEVSTDENLKDFNVKTIKSTIENGSSDNYHIWPESCEMGGVNQREPQYKMYMIEDTMKKALKEDLKKNIFIDPFNFKLQTTFLNPNDKIQINKIINDLEANLNDVKTIENWVKNFGNNEITKRPSDSDAISIPEIKQKLIQGSSVLAENLNHNRLSILLNKVRSPKLKQIFGLSCATYLSQIHETIVEFDGHTNNYDNLTYVTENELQDKHIEIIESMLNILNRLEKQILNLINALQAYE